MNKFSRVIIESMVIAMSMVGIAHAETKNWTGFYAGIDAGFAVNNAELESQQLGFTKPSEKCNIRSDFSTFFPGIQFGYLQQLPNDFVSGIEANVTVNTDQKDTLNCICPTNPHVGDRFTFRNQLQSSIKGRVGQAMIWNKIIFLPYLTAGASFTNVGLTYRNEAGDYYSRNTTQTGWLIGAGIEWAFKQNWSLRAEYYYVDYGNAITLKIPNVYGLNDTNGNAHVNLSSNNIILAINYWL
jgi:outer membrane immunogenic protein